MFICAIQKKKKEVNVFFASGRNDLKSEYYVHLSEHAFVLNL